MKRILFAGITIVLMLAVIALTGCNTASSAGTSPVPSFSPKTPSPESITTPPPRTDWEPGSPPPEGTGGWQAIETASRTLRPSIVDRAEIRAEMHGWYWEVIFDNLDAKADELMPWPLKGPPPPPPGQPTPEPYPGVWQSVIITVDAQTGEIRSGGARRAPRPGPNVSQEEAVESAGGLISRHWTADAAWAERAEIEAYLRGDTWIVLFWEKNSENNRIRVSVDAVTGEASGASRG